jgi:AraC family transcriptional regulator
LRFRRRWRTNPAGEAAVDQDAIMDLYTVEAELRAPTATAQVARYYHDGPSDYVTRRADVHWLDLGLTPRPANARARFVDDWSADHYERLGSVFLVPAGRAVQFRTDGGGMASVSCELRPDQLRDWLEADLAWSDEQLAANLAISNGAIRALMRRLGEELRRPGFASGAMAELIVAQVAIELSRHVAALGEAPAAAGGLAAWRLRLIDERLDEGREAPSLSDLAELCRLSVRHLNRGFRASRGISLGRYIEQSRLQHAKRRLAGDEGVKAIAHALGFSTPANFSYAFRRATGMTPNQFRASVRRGDR